MADDESVSSSFRTNVLLPGWEAIWDDESGKFYYFNEVTGATSWDKPIMHRAKPPPPPPPPPAHSDLPPGWEGKVSSSGKEYYIDHMNRVSTWVRPVTAAVLTSKVMAIEPDIQFTNPNSNHRGRDDSCDMSQMSESVYKIDDMGKILEVHQKYEDDILEPLHRIEESASVNSPTASKSNPGMNSLFDMATNLPPSPSLGMNNSSSQFSMYDESVRTTRSTFTATGPGYSRPGDTIFPAMTSERSIVDRLTYPDGEVVAASQELNSWVLLEAPRQKHVAPKGMHAIRVAMAKRQQDKSIAAENTDVRNVTVNGHFLTVKQVRWWAVQQGVRFRSDTHYWYDSKAGFMGKLGGPIKWLVVPGVDGPGSLHTRSSLGETTTYVNDREICEAEKKLWAETDMQLWPNTFYLVEGDGTTSRVGDDQPLYNWHEKVRALEKKRKSVVGKSLTSVGAVGGGFVGKVATGVVVGLTTSLIKDAFSG